MELERLRPGRIPGTGEWAVTLAGPVDYDLYASGKVVLGPAPNVSARDVRRTWIASHLGQDVDLDQPLWTYHPYVFKQLRHGRTSTILRIPTRKDGVDEGREALTIRLRVGKQRFERTVYVRG